MSAFTKKKIFYWSPSLVNIATNRAVINSCYALTKFSKYYNCSILNFFGEFERYREEIQNKKIILIDYFHKIIFNLFPRHGKIKSRISFIIIFFASFFPLKNLLKNEKPEYLIIHLISSLPLTLLLLFKFETKFILRISGFPKLNFVRKFFWRIAFKKIHLVTCPTLNTLNYIKNLKLIDSSKLKLLYDPIIEINEINKKKSEKLELRDYYLSVGRLTKQKNFLFLFEGFKKIVEINNKVKLLVAGNGEQENELKKFIYKNNLSKNIFLLGYVENIYPYLKNAKGFILTSLWEDPGFVLIEASYCRTPVLSSNSWPGPVELIKNDFNGILYENNNMESFLKKFKKFSEIKSYNMMRFNNLKMCRKFTIFNHYKNLSKLLF